MKFTRIPTYSLNKDNITGYVLKTDILYQIATGKPDTRISELKRDIRFVSELDSLSQLFDTLHLNQQHLAIVVDEYGGTSGLVTLEDLIETLLGLEIVDESDSEVDMRELARKRWEKRALDMGIIKQDDTSSNDA